VRLTEVRFRDRLHGWTAGRIIGDEAAVRIWRTEDGGRHWTSRPLPEVTEAAFDFADAQSGWAAGPSDCQVKEGQSRCRAIAILHTSDGGLMWAPQVSQKSRNADADNEVEAVSAETAFVRAGSRIWTTDNGGQSWDDVSLPDPDASPYRIEFPDGRTGFAAGRDGPECPAKGSVPDRPDADCRVAVWATTDGGNKWTRLSSAPQKNGEWYPADLQFLDDRTGWLLLVNPDTHAAALYATSDGARTWTARSGRLPGIRPYPVRLAFVNEREGWVPLSVGAGPIEGGLMGTSDGGETFQPVGTRTLISVEDADRLDPQTGWIIAMNPKRPEASRLLGTEDAGSRWTDLTPQGP
jgi:photosystem II stability/assembly factor-like uncharacterized protein